MTASAAGVPPVLDATYPATLSSLKQIRTDVSSLVRELRAVDRADLLILVQELVTTRLGDEARPIALVVRFHNDLITVEVSGGAEQTEVDPLAEVLLHRLTVSWDLRPDKAVFQLRERLAPAAAEETERDLFLRANAGDRVARDLLFDRYEAFAHALSRRFLRSGIPAGDLRQEASIGLVKAIDRFDPDFGVKFTTFGARTIEGELKRYLRDRGWSVRVPRGLQELGHEVHRVEASLAQDLGRQPTLEELALEIDMDLDEVGDAMVARQSFDAVSLDSPAGGDPDNVTLLDRLADSDGSLEIASDWADLSLAAQELSPRDRRILHLRYFEGLSQSEIAARVGVSQMHVSRLLTKSLDRLRELLGQSNRDRAESP